MCPSRPPPIWKGIGPWCAYRGWPGGGSRWGGGPIMCGGGGPMPGPYIMNGGAPRDPFPRAEKVPAFLLPLGPCGGIGIIIGGPWGTGPPLWGPPPLTGGLPFGALIPMKLPALIFRPPITDPDRPVAMSITDPLPRIPPVPFPMFPFIKGGFRSSPSIKKSMSMLQFRYAVCISS